MLLHAVARAADIQDRGGVPLMAAVFGRGGLRQATQRIKAGIAKRPDAAKGFVVLPKRWVAGRTIAWLNRCRRLAKDWECLSREALAFLRLASIRLMPRKRCQTSK